MHHITLLTSHNFSSPLSSLCNKHMAWRPGPSPCNSQVQRKRNHSTSGQSTSIYSQAVELAKSKRGWWLNHLKLLTSKKCCNLPLKLQENILSSEGINVESFLVGYIHAWPDPSRLVRWWLHHITLLTSANSTSYPQKAIQDKGFSISPLELVQQRGKTWTTCTMMNTITLYTAAYARRK